MADGRLAAMDVCCTAACLTSPCFTMALGRALLGLLVRLHAGCEKAWRLHGMGPRVLVRTRTRACPSQYPKWSNSSAPHPPAGSRIAGAPPAATTNRGRGSAMNFRGGRAALGRVWAGYEHTLSHHPIPTQVTTSALLWGLGDLLAQRVVEKREPLDKKRLLATAAFGASFMGPVGK